MASTEIVLPQASVYLVPLDAPASRVVVTMIAAATPSEVWMTADGSLPIDPNQGTEVPGTQRALPAVVGTREVLSPPLYNSAAIGKAGPPGRTIPTIRLLTIGSGVQVRVAW